MSYSSLATHHSPLMIARRDFLLSASAALLAQRFEFGAIARPRPTQSQLDWQRDELALFLHFGVNTFTDREWGDGSENPAIFAPTHLDARQWARVARDAGARVLILTAKHHDGFCLWPTKTTSHSVASSPWRSGQGDVVRELVDACRAQALGVGLYLSPWDRNAPSYGDSPRYNDFYCAQLTELLTQYGPLRELWFDGANGEGPNGRHQVYDWPRIWGLVRRHQPEAVIFSDAGPDVRWIGNERGIAAETNWSPVDPAAVPYPGASGDAVMEMLQHGDPRGSVWRPGETDVSIRPGWFYHPAEDERVKPVDDLVELYFSSVGRNSKLLLNVPPTPAGLLHERDAANLLAARRRLTSLFAEDLAAGRRASWRPTGNRTAVLEIDVGRSRKVAIADLREDVARGQRVARYTLTGSDGGAWQPLARGTTIGFRRLVRFTPTAIRRVRLTIEDAVATPARVALGLYG
ncbi:MAG TPA: alpha-L-fucosidase [Gemmatimonadaceae bacterium]|nr:alpha-L-fucosidase [Gemmatimonadaceae bacterium]